MWTKMIIDDLRKLMSIKTEIVTGKMEISEAVLRINTDYSEV